MFIKSCRPIAAFGGLIVKLAAFCAAGFLRRPIRLCVVFR
jgi:hypothetical protein